MKLSRDFYTQKNVTAIAKDLLGKVIVCKAEAKLSSGIIVETEAYSFKERGCHAYNNKRTARNEIMFGDGGFAYVYLCYGIHHLFNVVTNRSGCAEAVLVRAIEPLQGIEGMLSRRGMSKVKHSLSSGPGKLTQALGIDIAYNALDLLGNKLWIEDSGINYTRKQIQSSERIGIDYAGSDARLKWRFTVKDSPWLSRV